MRLSLQLYSAALLACLFSLATTPASAQFATPTQSAASRAQLELAETAQQGRFAFLVFFRKKDNATDGMVATLRQNLADKGDMASITYVQIADPAEQGLVKQYGVGRAPLPLTVALAPNGAMTAIHPRRIAKENIEAAFVSPAAADSLKALQEQKLVFITVSDSDLAAKPVAIQGFSSDPHFQNRMRVISLDANDASERKFLDDLEIQPNTPSANSLVVLAPPGVMVGKFASTATKDEIAGAIAEAGKCCDDPNCKHHHK